MVRTLLLFVKSWDEIHVSWKAITSKMVLPAECYLFKGASTWFVYLEKFNLSFQVRCLWSLCQSSPSLIIFVLLFFYLYCISSSLLSWQTIIFVKLVSIQTKVIFYMTKITLNSATDLLLVWLACMHIVSIFQSNIKLERYSLYKFHLALFNKKKSTSF